jgi:hypothetical protein
MHATGKKDGSMEDHELYEKDLFGWAIHNARLLREGNLADIDAENIAEELEGLARAEKRVLIRRISRLIISLIRWAVQPSKQCRCFIDLIEMQRLDVKEILRDCPSLVQQMDVVLKKAYKQAYDAAIAITGFADESFPEVCPYSLHQVLDSEIAFEPPELPQDLLDFADSIPDWIVKKAKRVAERDLGVKIAHDEMVEE